MEKVEKTQSMYAFEAFVKCATSNELEDKADYFKKNCDVLSYLKEWCTYRFCMHRNSGHTFNSIYVLPQFFRYTLIVCPNERICRYSRDLLKEIKYIDTRFSKILENAKIEFMAIDRFNKDYVWRGCRDFPDCICFDVSSLLSKRDIEKIYETCCYMESSCEHPHLKLFFME